MLWGAKQFVGKMLAKMEGVSTGWYGDLALNYCKDYGDIKQLAEESPYQHQTIIQGKYTASRYEIYWRQYNLSYEHYRVAAPLKDRLEWLKRAKENNWSTRKLEAEIHKASRLALPQGTFAY